EMGIGHRSYIVDTSELPNSSDAYRVGSDKDETGVVNTFRELVVYVGEEGEAVEETVSLWVTYTKRNIMVYPSLEEYEEAKEKDDTAAPALIAVNSDAVDWESDDGCNLLTGYVQSGIPLVFCNLPEISVMKENKQLQELLGIQMIRAEEMAVESIHLHKGFLLGGEVIYSAEGMEEGLAFSLPWYVLSSETEIYMNGIPRKRTIGSETIADEELPAILWRKDSETAPIFVVNGSYMADAAGLGILSAISAERNPYELYPIVNAQNMVYTNFPGLADENEDVLLERYSQTLEVMFQNVIWPDIVAVHRESGASLSCMLAPQLDYEDSAYPDALQFERYMKLLNEQKAETGLSGTRLSDTPVGKKLASDYKFMQEALPTYKFTSFYVDDMTEEEIWDALQAELLTSVRTIVENCNDDKEVIGYLSEYITRQSALIDGFDDSSRHDFRIRCLETALGYTSIMADMSRVAYPEQDGIGWVDASNTLRQNIQDYQIGKYGFDETTVSECDERIRSFLALDYRQRREFNSIYLEINDTRGPVWFVLRTDRESIKSMEGGSWKRLEPDVYLLTIEEKSAVITLKSDY
ncbi:MAG: DUF2194 domain-containing protein, partial [Lachnospiraceae bacterium]|nr:DUF2194 domain-containing protein [Lachnospiraceae bacterium]